MANFSAKIGLKSSALVVDHQTLAHQHGYYPVDALAVGALLRKRVYNEPSGSHPSSPTENATSQLLVAFYCGKTGILAAQALKR